MLVKRDRAKLIEAIKYFAENTHNCGKVKLYKLLYFLDFEHFKLTGRSVTGLEYNAWPMGPVPVPLHEEIEQPKPDLADHLSFSYKVLPGDNSMLVIKLQAPFSAEHFSRRELKIMASLAAEFKTAKADSMVEKTHLPNAPWDKVYVQDGKRQALIPYDLAVANGDDSDVLRIASERRDIIASLSAN